MNAIAAEAWASGYWHGTSHQGPLNDAVVAAKNPHRTTTADQRGNVSDSLAVSIPGTGLTVSLRVDDDSLEPLVVVATASTAQETSLTARQARQLGHDIQDVTIKLDPDADAHYILADRIQVKLKPATFHLLGLILVAQADQTDWRRHSGAPTSRRNAALAGRRNG